MAKDKYKHSVTSGSGLFVTIVLFTLFPMLLIALSLYLFGVRHVEFDDTYYNFLKKVVVTTTNWNIKIPNIPPLHKSKTITDGFLLAVLDVLINFFNFITTVVNVIINFINFVISIFTTIGAVVKVLFIDVGEYFRNSV